MATNNKEIIRKIYEVFHSENFDKLEQYIAADMTEHSPDPVIPVDKKGPAYVKEVISTYKKSFPDLKFNILDLVEEGDKIVAHVELTGTHKGDLMGIAPTNKQVKVEGFDMAKLADGKVTDHWGVWDYASMMQQVGKQL